MGKGGTKEAQRDSQTDSQRMNQGDTKGFTKGFTTAGPQRDNSGTTAGQQRDNSGTTAGYQRDNTGTTAGQPRQPREFFILFPPDVFYKKCVALLGPPASRADPLPPGAPLRRCHSLAEPGEIH